ncbi:Xylulose kinase [hydrothermal vent metagenome]|uniref:Xylulose kinase n=1 Tax=hydrothermal vent metagenome TaxID=652676 RepID=A0A3B0TT18_9ZZZZ
MSTKCVIGLDIGTTSTIGILIAPPDRVIASAARPTTFSSPKPGWAEEDPNQWWENVCSIIAELIEKSAINRNDICAIGVTGMLPAVILLDDDNNILRPSIQQSDGRCAEQVAELANELDEDDFVQTTGNGINQQLLAAKLRWIERHEPEIFNRIATVFGSYDFINWKLTGVKRVEQNWALEAGFIDLKTNEISPCLVDLAHIPFTAIPKKIKSHHVLGRVSPEAAAATGLPADIRVIGGAADHIASAYAAGIVNPGDVLLKFGGSTDILIATKKAHPDARMFLDYHLLEGLYMPNGCMASGGSALNWFATNFAGGEKEAAAAKGVSLHHHLDQIAAQIPAGAGGVQIIPYFLGEKTPIHDPNARGIIHGLSLNHDLRHLWRALLEGFGYAFRHHIDVFNDMGHQTSNFIASDGGANSHLWMQICADILQTPIQLLTGHPGSCLGAAWMAAIGSGLSENWHGVSAFVSYGDIIKPDPKNAPVYDAGYRRFRASYQALKKIDR